MKQYTLSKTTNKLVNIMASFDELNDELVKCVVDIYGSHEIDEHMQKYYNNFGNISDLLLEYIKESIDNNMVAGNGTEI